MVQTSRADGPVALSPAALRTAIELLDARGPFSEKLTEALAVHRSKREPVWYQHQKEHWLGWLGAYDGPGAYGRKVHSGRTAEFVYNHIMCPPMILWLGEAVGIGNKVMKQAVTACLEAGRTLPKQCGAIRSHVPWSMIVGRLPAVEPRPGFLSPRHSVRAQLVNKLLA